MSVWLVAVPNESGRSSETTFLELKAETASARHDYAECYRMELPSDLLVGTLDSLMALSDDLNRVDMTIESVVRKIERQFHDLNKDNQALTVDGVPVDRYLNYFAWDEAKHPHRRPLPEIVSIVQTSVSKIEDELKQLSQRYTEKKQQLQSLQKKKGGNLMVANLSDVLTPDLVSASDFVNTEYLQTFVAIVPKNLEETWLNEYHTIGDQIAEYGPKGARSSVRGSPVVPGSSRKLLEEGDACVYSVTVLKGQYTPGHLDKDGTFEQGAMHDYVEDFKTRAREKRFVIREFNFDPTSHASNEEAIAELEVEVDRLWSGLVRWCKAHFGETFIAWMHIKMIRVFVESVLRYGLPVNFVVAMYRAHKGKEKKLRTILAKKYAHLQPSQFSGVEESSSGSGAQAEYYPYVTNAFHPLSTGP